MLYYKATAGCGVGMFVGVSARKRAAPVALILGRVAALPPPSAAFLSLSFATRCTLTGPIRMPCSVVPPPRSSSSTYRIRAPRTLRGPLLLGVKSYPPAFSFPLLALPLLIYPFTTVI